MSDLEQESPMITAGNSNVPDLDEAGDVKYLGPLGNDGRKWEALRQIAPQTQGLPQALGEIAYQIRCRRLTSGEPAQTESPADQPAPEAPAGVTYSVPRDKLYVALVKVLSQEIFENAADLVRAANEIVAAVEAEVNS